MISPRRWPLAGKQRMPQTISTGDGAEERLLWLPWHGPRSEILEVCARAQDPLGPGWVYCAKKRDTVADDALNLFSEGENQVDHILALKSYGASSSLAQWARLLGMRWLGANGQETWQGVMLYPDVAGLNARMRALSRDTGHFVFVANESGVDIPHIEYAKTIARGMVPLGSHGSTHFHDLLTHALGYAMYPPDMVRNITQQLCLMLHVYEDAAANVACSRTSEVNAWKIVRDIAERQTTAFIKVLDRHSTFLPMLILPDDHTKMQRTALAAMDAVQHVLIHMTRGLRSRSTTQALSQMFSLLEERCSSRHASMDVIFAALENCATFDRRIYGEFSTTLLRDVPSLRAELIRESRSACLAMPIDVDLQGLLDKVHLAHPPAAEPSSGMRPGASSCRKALELRLRLRREIKAIINTQQACRSDENALARHWHRLHQRRYADPQCCHQPADHVRMDGH
jgi:hypothetical protein